MRLAVPSHFSHYIGQSSVLGHVKLRYSALFEAQVIIPLAVCPTQGFGVILRCVVLNIADQISFTLSDSLHCGLDVVFLLQVPAKSPCITVVRDVALGFHCKAPMELNHIFPEVPPLAACLAWLSSANLTYRYFSLAACCWGIPHILGLWGFLLCGGVPWNYEVQCWKWQHSKIPDESCLWNFIAFGEHSRWWVQYWFFLFQCPTGSDILPPKPRIVPDRLYNL